MGEYADDEIDRFIFGYSGHGRVKRQRYHRPAPKGSELAKARIEAHKSLDAIWQFGYMSRTQAYHWLAAQMGLNRQDCHISYFGIDACRKVVRICDAYRPPDSGEPELMA